MRRLFFIVTAVGLLAASCGGSGSSASGTTTTTSTLAVAEVASQAPAPEAAPSAKFDPVPPGRHSYSVRGVLGGPAATDGASVARTREYEWASPVGERQRIFPADLPSDVTEVEYRDDGVYLVSFTEMASGKTLAFVPAQPVLLLPLPARAGRTWSFELSSTDGCTVWNFEGRVDAIDVTVTIGAKDTSTTRVHQGSTFRDSGKQGCTLVAWTTERSLWMHPDYYFFLRQELEFQGQVGATNSSGEELAILRSGVPL